MISADTWAEIRRLYRREKLRIAEIARYLNLHRDTVRSAIKSKTYSSKKITNSRDSKLKTYKPYLKKRLEEYPTLSAVRLIDEIREQGYQGGFTILRDYLSSIRISRKTAYLTLSFPPGKAVQVDWASCGNIKVGRFTRRLSCFVMVLCYSRMLYLEFTISECLEEFLRCC